MPGSIEKKIFKELYGLYGHAPAQEPLPQGLEIFNFGRPLLGHHYYTHSLYGHCTGVEEIF